MNPANLHCAIEKPFFEILPTKKKTSAIEAANPPSRGSRTKARQRTTQIRSYNPLNKAQFPIKHVRPHGLQQMGRHRRQQRRGERRRSAKCAQGGPGADGRENVVCQLRAKLSLLPEGTLDEGWTSPPLPGGASKRELFTATCLRLEFPGIFSNEEEAACPHVDNSAEISEEPS